jgi:hypothetical protein
MNNCGSFAAQNRLNILLLGRIDGRDQHPFDCPAIRQ